MSSAPTTTGPILAPTNTVNPLPATPAEAAARAAPAAAGAALDLHMQTEDAAKENKNAQKAEKAEKAYAQKKKCMTARKEWYDCKVHFAAGVQGFREGGKCVGRVVKAGPALAMEKVKGGKGQGVKSMDSGASGESIMVEKENANKKSGAGAVKAKVMGLKEKLLAMKEKRAMEKQAKSNENAAIDTPTASGAVATTPVAEATPVAPVAPVVGPAAPVAAAPVPSPTQTKQEKKRMTLDQRIQQEEAKALARQEAEASAANATAPTGETPVVAPIPTPVTQPQGLTPIQTTQTATSLANPPQLPPKTQLSPPGSPTKGTMEPIHEDGETGALPLASGAQGAVQTQNVGAVGGGAPAGQ
ncbi:hypothetical protein EAE96_006150 [Botrytis aclada]|nr:hypothetical protein EAE96_006150 [Botrytis aclada]